MAIAAWRLGYFDPAHREQLIADLRRFAELPWAVPAFSLAYAAAVVLALPTTVLTIVAGMLFGVVRGVALVWVGAMVGSMAAHALARWIARGPVERLLRDRRLFRALRDRADVVTLMRLRVLPMAPFGVLDYATGLLRVPLRNVLVATAIAILPGTAVYAYAGDRLGTGLSDPGPAGRQALVIAALVTVAVTCVALVPWVVGRWRAADAVH